MDHLKNVKTFTFLCKSTYAQNLFIAFQIVYFVVSADNNKS